MWLLAVLAGVLAGPTYAIDPQRAMSQYVHDRWGTEQGFPRGPVYAIAQTTDGYLWIGTDAGLVRFDGQRFRVVQEQPQTPELTSVLGLAADNDGSLWVRLRDTRLLRYRHGVFDAPFANSEPGSAVTAMARAKGGELLVAKLQQGAYTYRGKGLALVAPIVDVPRSPILAIAQSGDGDTWLGTRGAGLFRLKGGRAWSITQGLPDPKVNCLLSDGKAGLWIGTDNGIVRWNGSALTMAGVPAALRGVQILALLKDRDGNLWVGTDSMGFVRLNGAGAARLDEERFTSHNAVTALFEDREGSLWIGSAGGLERLRDSPFVTYSDPEGVPTDGSKPVFVDGEQRTWFASALGGLWWLKEGRHGQVNGAGLEKDTVYAITGAQDELWLGRQHGGLTRLRPADGGFAARSFTIADGLAQNSVYSVCRTRAGVIWAGTLSGGVSRLDREVITTCTKANGLASNTVASILEGADGTMWFATPSGLSSLVHGHWQTFTRAEGLPAENVNCLLEDAAGVLWAGTTAGLAFRQAGHFTVPATAPALLREQILGLAADRHGSLWIATSSHVLQVNRGKLLQGTLTPGDVREYGLADGLRGMEGVKRHQSVMTDALGRVWFSLNRGISVVDPARLQSSSASAIAQVQTIAADGAPLALVNAVRVAAGRQRIVLGYAGLSLSVPERVRFRYRLDGFDHRWSEPVAEREAVYTNLGPGPYRFRVVASNPDGIWSGDEASLAFVVDPAYWQTWWFRAGSVLACALAALAFYRLRLRQLTGRLHARFEERLAERGRIAQELHDTLLQGFLSASLHVHVAADRLPADSQVKPGLTRALELMRQVIDEGRNAVRGLRSTQSASMDLEDAFAQIQDELSNGGDVSEPVDFRITSEGLRLPLHPVLRDEVYRIGREALINAFRHAAAKRVELELSYSTHALRLLVRDDGCGIEPRTLQVGREGHWGLAGMRERADRIGARLRLWSSTNRGTEVELTVPGHLAFQQQPATGAKRPRATHPTVQEKSR